ncbi:hypothetical protein [Marivita geojedonensis]|uniref:Uncharacterized protein n=1 Tax=Marivita geojedonensis TaxID=1123756 RepID=A0A1X4N8Z1_9RHOB|nr:hypothetical protein [Marivita geojedonensis]OSQ42794.1 hypothetical protein MGEO_20255 [Marivita geojedonensis]PRY71826.1 hypothetical protein CLV76_1405 [Marivita geojedonensis]
MGKPCADILDFVPETVVLAFDVTGITDPKDATRIAKSKDVQKAMEAALAEKGRALVKKHFSGKEITSEDALEMLKAPGSKLLDKRKKDFEKRLSCAYDQSPIGAWIDRNTWVLYVFVPLLIGGAGTYMYVAKAGDTPASWAASFASNQSFEVTKLGKIEIGTGDIKLVPSKTVISGKVFGKASFEHLKIKLEVAAGSAEHKPTESTYFAGVSPALNMTHILNRDMKLNYGLGFSNLGTQMPDATWVGKGSTKFSYTPGGAAGGLNISIGGDLAFDRYGQRSIGADLSAGYKGKLGDSTPFSVGATAGYDHLFRQDPAAKEQSDPGHSFNVMLNLKVGIPFP